MSKLFYLSTVLLFISGCASHSQPQPAKVWGMVGASYEATKTSGYDSKSSTSGSAVSTLKVEKSVGSVGIGGEVAGRL